MDLSAEEDEKSFHPRKPFLAAALSFILPGLGQVYNGNLSKGLGCFIFIISLPFLFGWSGILSSFGGFIALFLCGSILRIYLIVEAFLDARKKRHYSLKPYNKTVYLSLISVVFLGIYTLYNYQSVTGFRTFDNPTIANMPTIHDSEKIMVDFNSYNTKSPSAGDLVAFETEDQIVTIYRIIGQPGDTIDLQNGKISVNNKQAQYTFIKNNTDQGQPVEELEERLPHGATHHIFRYKNLPPTQPKHYVVPQNKYFLLGDNRDNAADSRYIGFISKEQIRGNPLYVFWNKDLKRLGTNLH